MAGDVRALSALVLGWLRPQRIQQLNARTRPHFEEIRSRLAAWAGDPEPPPPIDVLLASISDALALVDFNFAVLRDSGGDLEEYADLLLSHRTYHALWPPTPP